MGMRGLVVLRICFLKFEGLRKLTIFVMAVCRENCLLDRSFFHKSIRVFNEPQEHRDFVVHPKLSVKISNMSLDSSVFNLQSFGDFFVG